ncbi:MAG: PUA domain-containing protein [Candidatus Syntropharchaeia archaeon]
MIKKVRVIADYQFGKGAGKALFSDSCKFIHSKNHKIRQIMEGGKRIATLRASDGFLTLSIEGARRLHTHFPYPKLRVVMDDESIPFILEGKSAFAKNVIAVDPEIRAYEEVLLVDKRDNLIGTGKAILSAEEMLSAKRGVAVKVRYTRKHESY